jgi:hypothetical protein
MSGFKLDLIRPMDSQHAEKTLFRRELEYRRDVDPIMKALPNGFQLRMIGENIDPAIIMKTVFYRFVLNGDELERVQPVASNGRDFVDEWLQSPWSDAARWSAAENLEQLDTMQKHLMADNASMNSDDYPELNYGPVRSCPGSKSHFQVELDEEWVGPKADPTRKRTLYFQIEEGKNSFTMLSASTRPDPHCTGHDIMPAL